MTSIKKGLVTHITSALFILESVAFPQMCTVRRK